ncbi:MAG: protoporphyrinogen/coproporphyrinogen oxidase [Gemmatimonadales bacterium]
MTVAVVGAGLTGLAAAWELTRGGADVLVLESERRAGGLVLTERQDGFVIEAGPDGWLAAEPEIPTLAEELGGGLAGRLVRQSVGGTFHWTGTALEPLEEGRAAALLGIQARGEDLAAGFMSFRGGMGELVDALLGSIGQLVRSPAGLTGLIPNGTRWRMQLTGGAQVEAEAVVLAMPAYAAGRVLEQAGVTGARELGAVTYYPSLTVSLAYRDAQIGRRLEGTGFVSSASGVVRACTYASRKFPGRAPPDYELVRAFLSPVDGDPAVIAHRELAAVLRIRVGEPVLARSFLWPKGIPRYGAEQRERVAEARRRLTRLPPLAIAGAGYDGAGVSACVRSGRQAAQLIARRMTG